MNMHSAFNERPIGELIEPVSLWNPRNQAKKATFLYIDIRSVSQSDKIILQIKPIEAKSAPARARQLVRRGDVLVSTVRPNLNAVARVPPGLDGATASTGFCVLRPDMERLSGSYLFHWVRSSSFVDEMVRCATGQSYPAVSDRIVKQSKIPLPGIEEQERIAAILDKVDNLRHLHLQAAERSGRLLKTLSSLAFEGSL